MGSFLSEWKFKTLLFVILFLVAISLVAYAYATFMGVSYMEKGGRTISVVGYAKKSLPPDIASFSFAVTAEDKDATVANKKVTETVATINAFLKEQGISDVDIKTGTYSVSPKYADPVECTDVSCPPQSTKQEGYTVDQTVAVTVHDLSKVESLVTGVIAKGATSLSSLVFSVDALVHKKDSVRQDALADGKRKAEALAQTMGVRLGRLASYYEESYYGQSDYSSPSFEMMRTIDGKAIAPAVSPGQNDIEATANLVYEIF